MSRTPTPESPGGGIADSFRADHRDVLRFATSRLGDVQAAEDITAETYTRMFERRYDFESRDHRRRWAFVVARNLCADFRRRATRTVPAENGVLDSWLTPTRDAADGVAENCWDPQFLGALASLRPVEQEALLRRDVEGENVGSIASDLGLTPGSTRVLLSRARVKVRGVFSTRASWLAGVWNRTRQGWSGGTFAAQIAEASLIAAVVICSGSGASWTSSVSRDAARAPLVADSAPLGNAPNLAHTWSSPRRESGSRGGGGGHARVSEVRESESLRVQAGPLDLHEASRPETQPVVGILIRDDVAGEPNETDLTYYSEEGEYPPPRRACVTVDVTERQSLGTEVSDCA